ncbi:glycosyltransferase [Chlorobaculum sp. 24CR]|uniref:glycosyltransferase family 2 protein n=1 Tax=Chlorobaculum sp. 24CR TaxID=2508878 RepID=UPI00100BB472|nr:glycosyltransferase family 2 protein [Chlorobaculum sp. 24CR]RXK85032.1 glycosyltransferase [Chlorobaculum sp. 24CR]
MHFIVFTVTLLVILLSIPALYLIIVTIAAYLFRKEELAANRMFEIGVLIPAHNEEAGIAGTIESIKAGNYPAENVKIFVIADNCDDNTAEVARNAGATVVERTNLQNRGKGQALDWFLKRNKALYDGLDVITIIDADVRADRNYLREVSLSFSQPGIQALQGYNGVSNPDAGWRPGLLDAAFNVFNHLRMAGPFQLSGTCALKGNGMAFDKFLLEETGWPCHSIVEDMEFSFLLLMNEISVHYNPDAIVRSEMVTSGDSASSQRSRWESGRFKLVGQMALPLLRLFFSTGQIRYLVSFAELTVPPLSLLVLLFAVTSLLSLIFLDRAWMLPIAAWWAILLFYVVSGQIQRHAGLHTWRVLVAAPLYILWKIPLYLAMAIRKKSDAWVRTKRENESSAPEK